MEKESSVEESVKALTELAERGIKMKRGVYRLYLIKSLLLAITALTLGVVLVKLDDYYATTGIMVLIVIIVLICYFIYLMETWRDSYCAWLQLRNSVSLTEQMIKSLSTVNGKEDEQN